MLSQQEIDSALEIAEELEARGTSEGLEDSEAVEFEVALRRDLLHPKLVTLTHRPKSCPRCGGAFRDVSIEYMTRTDEGLVVIREVPAFHCVDHGHEYLLEETLDRLEALIELEQAEQVQPEEMLQVPVFQLLKTA